MAGLGTCGNALDAVDMAQVAHLAVALDALDHGLIFKNDSSVWQDQKYLAMLWMPAAAIAMASVYIFLTFHLRTSAHVFTCKMELVPASCKRLAHISAETCVQANRPVSR